MIYFINNVHAVGLKNFIADELIRSGQFDLDNYFNVAVNRSILPRKYVVEVIFFDVNDNNIVQLTSIPVSSRDKAVKLANFIVSNFSNVNKLNF